MRSTNQPTKTAAIGVARVRGDPYEYNMMKS